MELSILIEQIRGKAQEFCELKHKVLFDIDDTGKILVDTTGDQILVIANPNDPEAETTFKLSVETFENMMSGKLNPMVAFTLGKIRIEGSRGIALKLSSLLDQ
jgi:putative sterol carrier protein